MKTYRIPPSLKAGDKIALVATARHISEAELQPAIELLKSWNLQPVMVPDLFAIDRQFAGTDNQRRTGLEFALNEKDIRAILCVRGGYGTVRLLEKLDASALQQDPKWIIGYSDITVLHGYLKNNYNLASLHASMPVNFANNTPEALNSLKEALFNGRNSFEIPAHSFNRDGEAEGPLMGGNLSMLYGMTGTMDLPELEGSILFLEDLDEYLYHIDRMMWNFKRGGVFEKIAGLVVGGMSDMRDNNIPFGRTAEEIIKEAVASYNFPVCFGFPAGHVADNRALIMGKKTKLAVHGTASLAN